MSSLVPLYAYPTPSALRNEWDVIGSLCNDVSTRVILNPNNGNSATCSGGNPNAAWQQAQSSVSSCETLGYVYTQYGARPLADVKAIIDSYLQCWGW